MLHSKSYIVNKDYYARSFITVLVAVLIVILSGCGSYADDRAYESPKAGDEMDSPKPTSDDSVNPTEAPNGNHSGVAEPFPQSSETDLIRQEAQRLLDDMSVEEKIGQLMLIGFSDIDLIQQWIREHKVGGIVLFSRNYNTFEKLHRLTGHLREFNKDNAVPLFIAMDEEGGTVSRLPKGKTPVPGAYKVGIADEPDLTRKTGLVIGRELAAAGVNFDLAPVLDIVVKPENKFMYKRSYGASPDMVSRHGLAFIDGLKEAGVLACAKHFPGHGDTTADSHYERPVIDKTFEDWWKFDAVPFRAAVEAGVDSVMIGHLAFPAIEPSGLPATQSNIFMKEILRDRMGYEGLIITDDVEMMGYPKGEEFRQAIIDSFLAGVDIFAVGHTNQTQLNVLNALKEGFSDGRISEQRIDESVLRILVAKVPLKGARVPTLEEAGEIFGSDEHKAAIKELLEDG